MTRYYTHQVKHLPDLKKPCRITSIISLQDRSHVIWNSKRLSSLSRSLEIKYNEQTINVTTSYKYLGVSLDRSLNVSDHFNETYKKNHPAGYFC